MLRARREAADAQVIVANHHLLFADLAARMNGAGYENTAVLPAFRALVLDEAHAVESSATAFFSAELTRFSVNKRLVAPDASTRQSRLRPHPPPPRAARLPRRRPRKAAGGDRRGARRAMDDLDNRAVRLFDSRSAWPRRPARAHSGHRAERSYRLTETTPALNDLLLTPMAALERRLIACAQLLSDALDEALSEAPRNWLRNGRSTRLGSTSAGSPRPPPSAPSSRTTATPPRPSSGWRRARRARARPSSATPRRL